MTSRLVSISLTGIGLCAFFTPLSAQSPGFDPVKAVKEISAKCEAAKEYVLEGDLEFVGQRGTAPAKVLTKAGVRLAESRPGRYLLRLAPQDKNEYLMVSSGQKTWAFVPKLKQYTEEETGMVNDSESGEESGSGDSDQERDPAETWSKFVIPLLARAYKTAQGVDLGGTGEVKYENKKQRWPIVRVMSKPDPKDGQSLTELTVDPQTLAIRRMVWSNLTRKDGEKIILRLTVDFQSFRIGESLTESTFIFEPPKNAKLVDAVPIPGQTGSFLVNQPAPDFELKTLEGEKLRFADFRGKQVLLSFWASWCGPCRRELPAVSKLNEEFKGKGLVVIGVNDEGKGPARQYVKEAGLTFPTLDDSGLKAHRLYRVRSIPTTFLIDSQGKIVRFFSGAKDESTLRAALKNAGL